MSNADWAPLVITPDTTDQPATAAGLLAVVADTDVIDKLILEHQALVFRGFGLGADRLDEAIDQLLSTRLAYVHGNSPRTKVGSNLYTSTEYPAEFTISMHNELSYSHSWPARLLFYCQQAARTGGATPVVDAAAWLAALDPEVRDRTGAACGTCRTCTAGAGSARAGRTPSKPATVVPSRRS